MNSRLWTQGERSAVAAPNIITTDRIFVVVMFQHNILFRFSIQFWQRLPSLLDRVMTAKAGIA